MKKIFAIALAACLMVGLLCITALAADEPTAQAVIRVSGMKKGGALHSPQVYSDFAEGWEAAVDLALNEEAMDKNGYERVVVDLYADWVADESGKFGKSSWTGFQYTTIYVPSGVSMTVNMNGHKIDRSLEDDEKDGEVIYVDTRADLIINGGQSGDSTVKIGEDAGYRKMGTITGGNSHSGAGGIYINDGARVTLNNVHVDGNRAEDDDGAAIAVYNGAVLVMNGGSISHNLLNMSSSSLYAYPYGALYLNDSEAFLTEVEIAHNGLTGEFSSHGSAIYADDSEVTLQNCLVADNSHIGGEKKLIMAYSVIELQGTSSFFKANGCKFENNGQDGVEFNKYSDRPFSLIKLAYGAGALIEDCKFVNNAFAKILEAFSCAVTVKGTDFVDNNAWLLYGSLNEGSSFTECTFSGNVYEGNTNHFMLNSYSSILPLRDCDFAGQDPARNTKLNISDSGGHFALASMMGDGSLMTVILVFSFVATTASVGVNIVLYKRQAALKDTDASDDDDD